MRSVRQGDGQGAPPVVRGLRLGAALLALVLAGSPALAGCGDDGGDTSAAATTATAATTSTGAETGSGDPGDGADDGGNGSRDGAGEGGPSGDGRSGQGSGSGSSDDDGSSAETDFASQLRSIVTETFAELQPLATPGNAMGDPEAYVEMLETGVGQIDDTIEQLEALDPPADAEEGTQQVIDAFSGLRASVADGAEALGSGDSDRVGSGLQGLREGAAEFGTELQGAAESLRDAGYGVPGT